MTAPAECRAAIDAYIAETLRFARVLNLTSVREPETFRQRFVLPSLAMCRWLPERGRLLDLGSGMGIPGIPILLARRAMHGVLVERRKKRAEFLRHIVRILELDAEVYAEDIRALPALNADACVARAVAEPVRLLRLMQPHTIAGGVAVLPVSERAPEAKIPGWRFEGEERLVVAGMEQRIHRYRLVGTVSSAVDS